MADEPINFKFTKLPVTNFKNPLKRGNDASYIYRVKKLIITLLPFSYLHTESNKSAVISFYPHVKIATK